MVTKKPLYYSCFVAAINIFLLDDSVNLKMLKMLLTKYGIEVTCAVNGQAAADLVLQHRDEYVMVLMDNLMPIMVGAHSPSVMPYHKHGELMLIRTAKTLRK